MLSLLQQQVAIEDDPRDLQLLSTGINDRNVEDYLGLIEQRIDDIIQISKAALHEPLSTDDYLNHSNEIKPIGLNVSHLHSLLDNIDNVDDNNDDNIRIAPVNIMELKDQMSRKVQNAILKASARLASNNQSQSRRSFQSATSRSSLNSQSRRSSHKK
eukprot:gene18817-24587_t